MHPSHAPTLPQLTCRMSATTPAVWGDAMLVPLITTPAESLAMPADKIAEPGAKMSTQLPTLEKEERASRWSDDATAIA